MALSRIQYPFAGSMQFAASFALGYNYRDEVKCYVEGELDGSGGQIYRTMDWISATLFNMGGTPPAIGAIVVVERTIDKDTLINEYDKRTPITSKNLDESFKQAIMAVHEALDGRFGTLAVDLDMGNNQIKNLAPGTVSTDAVTLGQLGGYPAEAEAFAIEAEGFRDEAEAFKIAAGEAAIEAAVERDASEDAADAADSARLAAVAAQLAAEGFRDDAQYIADTLGVEFPDDTFRVTGSTDATKKVSIEVDGLTTATTRTLTVQDKDGTLATLADSTLPNAGYRTDGYYFGLGYDQGSPVTVASGRLYARPFLVSEKVTFNRIGLNVQTLSAGDARLGLYKFENGYPTTLIADYGTVSTGSTGAKEITISQTLEPGLYALACIFSSTPGIDGINSNSSTSLASHFSGRFSFSGGVAFAVKYTTAYGALPASIPYYPTSDIETTSSNVPTMWMRKV